jgi:hypothetical protein
MSSDEQHISFPCYIPNGPTSNGLELISTIALLETNGTIDTSTKFSSNQIIYRALKTGNIIYFSGNFLVGYSTVGSNDFVSLVADIKQVQDVYVYDGNLLASNWDENPWGMATIGSGLPLTTAGQTATLYWTVNLVRIPTSVLFFENGNGKFAYMTIDYPSATLHRLKYENSEWVIEYKTSYNFGTGAIPTSTIFYDNGDGMTIVLMATSHKIYKITDTGTSLTSVTEIVSRPNVLIKGIEWAPSTIYLGGEPETVPNEPEAAPVPSTDPVAAPLDEPAAPVANTPSSNGPISSSPVTPSPNAPISDQTPADGPIGNSVPNVPLDDKASPKSTISQASSLVMDLTRQYAAILVLITVGSALWM